MPRRLKTLLGALVATGLLFMATRKRKSAPPAVVSAGNDESSWVAVGIVNGNTSFKGRPALLAPRAASAWIRMTKAMLVEAKLKPVVNSAGRTYLEQKRLYDAHLPRLRAWQAREADWKARGSPESEKKALYDAKPTPVAEPGKSNHNGGVAVDVATEGGNNPKVLAWFRANGKRFGWVTDKVAREPWHLVFEG